MKAVGVFPQRREVCLVEHGEPQITAPDEVKVRIIEVGVCGTDRELCAFHFGTPPPGFDYFVLGHESLGEVVETGAAVETLKPGDLAFISVRRPCAHQDCAPCRSGRPDFCATGGYAEHGIKDLHGFMTSFVVDSEQYVRRVPQRLRDVGVLVEPLTIAEKAFIQVAAIQRRPPFGNRQPRAAVLGAGPIGLLGAMLLANAHFETHIYSRSPASSLQASIAKEFGAQYISSAAEPVEAVRERIGEVDLIYEAMGAPQTAFEAMELLGANGVFVFTGVPGPDVEVKPDAHRILLNMNLKNQVVLGTINAGPDACSAAIHDIDVLYGRWPEALASMITGRYPIEAFREAISGGDCIIKNVVTLEQGRR